MLNGILTLKGIRRYRVCFRWKALKELGRLKSVMCYWQNTTEICKASFRSIGNVSGVYRLLKFELKSSPYISSIQQKVHFLKKKPGNGRCTQCFDLFHRGYLKDKVCTQCAFPLTNTDELKRKVMDNIRQIILHTFPVVTKNFCQERICCLDGKTVN